MKKYFKYFKYVIKHKYYVAKICFKFGLYWRGIMHDNSKFLPFPFISYANYFYGGKKVEGIGKNGYLKPSQTRDKDFDMAWLIHQKSERHHWQFWILVRDTGETLAIEMPHKYVIEMVCDWAGASIATEKSKNIMEVAKNTKLWYNYNKDKIILHNETRKHVESMIDVLSMLIEKENKT